MSSRVKWQHWFRYSWQNSWISCRLYRLSAKDMVSFKQMSSREEREGGTPGQFPQRTPPSLLTTSHSAQARVTRPAPQTRAREPGAVTQRPTAGGTVLGPVRRPLLVPRERAALHAGCPGGPPRPAAQRRRRALTLQPHDAGAVEVDEGGQRAAVAAVLQQVLHQRDAGRVPQQRLLLPVPRLRGRGAKAGAR